MEPRKSVPVTAVTGRKRDARPWRNLKFEPANSAVSNAPEYWLLDLLRRPIATTTTADLRDRGLILLGCAGTSHRSELAALTDEHIRPATRKTDRKAGAHRPDPKEPAAVARGGPRCVAHGS